MAQVIAIYNTPTDLAAFDTYYAQTHTPIAKKMPGLRSYTTSDGLIQSIAGDAPYLVAILAFDSMDDVRAALASPEGQATAADLQNFATGGVTVFMSESKQA